MRDYQCFCGMCGKNHSYTLFPDEYRMLAALHGAIQEDGRLSLACDECKPFTLSRGVSHG